MTRGIGLGPRSRPSASRVKVRNGAVTVNSLVLQLEFDRAHRKAVLRDLVAFVSRRPNRLIPYHEARRGTSGAESYRGVRSVPIARIVGSVDRFDDFDRAFLPRRRHSSGRWQHVARAHADGRELPPVQLYEIGGDYFVQDGHHRISVARLNGQQFIEAEITAAAVSGSGEADARQRPNRARDLTAGLRSLGRVLVPRPRSAAPAVVGALGCTHAAASRSCCCP